jgi:hypothetical protein
MSDLTIKEAEALITERVCRVTFDCTIRISGILPEVLRKSGYKDKCDQELALRDAERQSQLFHALLCDKRALDQFLTYVVANDFGMLFDADLDVRFPVEEDDAILKRIYSVAGDDKASFIDEDSSDVLVEDTEFLHACFKVDWRATVLRGIELVQGGTDPEEVKR